MQTENLVLNPTPLPPMMSHRILHMLGSQYKMQRLPFYLRNSGSWSIARFASALVAGRVPKYVNYESGLLRIFNCNELNPSGRSSCSLQCVWWGLYQLRMHRLLCHVAIKKLRKLEYCACCVRYSGRTNPN